MFRLTLVIIFGCLACSFSQAQFTKIANNLIPAFTAILQPTSGTGNSTVIFAEAGTGKIWVSDGTPINTYPLAVPVTLPEGETGIVFQDKLYFSGLDETGKELWVTDGTVPGTMLVKDIWQGEESSSPHDFFTYKNKFVFYANNGVIGDRLWITDGTGTGTEVLEPSGDFVGGYYAILKDELYFTSGFSCGSLCFNAELWKTDGTTTGTQKVVFLGQTFRYYKPEFLFSWKDHIYFQGGGQEYGFQLWISDGTAAGTHVLKPSEGDPVMNPDKPAILGDKLIFRADNRLWVTDGTAAGTLLIDSLEPGFSSSSKDAIIINRKLMYAAYNEAEGNGYEIHETDGTKAGTRLFSKLVDDAEGRNIFFWVYPGDYLSKKDTIQNFSERLFKGKVFITVWYNIGGDPYADLWSTDGTIENTKKVHQFFDYSRSYFFGDSIIYFVDKDAEHGTEIFTTDGSPGSANFFADAKPGSESSSPQFLFKVNGKVFLTAYDGAQSVFVIEDNGGVLPVKFLTFTAKAQEDAVRLNWEISNDLNARRFEVERSTDGQSFESIAILSRSTNNQAFRFDDKTAYTQSANTLYYRLKLFDSNQEFSYSKIEKVLLRNNLYAFSIAPNPVRDIIQVRYTTSLDQRTMLSIFNSGGKLIQTYQLPATNGFHQQPINVSNLPKGMYYLKISSGAETPLSTSFVKE